MPFHARQPDTSLRHQALYFEPLVIREIRLYAQAGEQFLRVEVHFAVELRNRGARILDGFLARPFHDSDEVEFARALGLFQDKILKETWLRLEERVSRPHFLKKFFPSAAGNDKLIHAIDSLRHTDLLHSV
jgi:hypothetical protein